MSDRCQIPEFVCGERLEGLISGAVVNDVLVLFCEVSFLHFERLFEIVSDFVLQVIPGDDTMRVQKWSSACSRCEFCCVLLWSRSAVCCCCVLLLCAAVCCCCVVVCCYCVLLLCAAGQLVPYR